MQPTCSVEFSHRLEWGISCGLLLRYRSTDAALWAGALAASLVCRTSLPSSPRTSNFTCTSWVVSSCCCGVAQRAHLQDYKSLERRLASPAGLSQQELQEKRQHLARCKQVRRPAQADT
eukprot:GHRQ01030722.1.p1 GENE.GHRQ01030722.1~~GHRQ01030722.1.p1  ORF type:complete len:119 (-),score=27.71 GHRQ01030722.1:36-392(-)